MELSDEIKRDVQKIKELIINAGNFKLVDTLNELVKLATSKQLIEETLDESYDALQPTGSTLIENINIYIYGKEEMEINNKKTM